MSPFPPEPERPTTTPRTAQLRLRGLELTASVTWPIPHGNDVMPALVVHFPDPRFTPSAGAESAVVLSAPAHDVEEAWRVVAWAADHAPELGADPEILRLAGNSSLCEAVRARARGNGWPPIADEDYEFLTRQVPRAVD